MVSACVLVCRARGHRDARLAATARARQLRHEAGVPGDLRRLTASEVAQRRALDERALGAVRSRQCRQRGPADRLAARGESRHRRRRRKARRRAATPARRRAPPSTGSTSPDPSRVSPRRSAGEAAPAGSRRPMRAAAERIASSSSRSTCVAVSASARWRRTRSRHVGALVIAEAEALCDLSGRGRLRAPGGPGRRLTCRRRERAPPPGVPGGSRWQQPTARATDRAAGS